MIKSKNTFLGKFFKGFWGSFRKVEENVRKNFLPWLVLLSLFITMLRIFYGAAMDQLNFEIDELKTAYSIISNQYENASLIHELSADEKTKESEEEQTLAKNEIRRLSHNLNHFDFRSSKLILLDYDNNINEENYKYVTPECTSLVELDPVLYESKLPEVIIEDILNRNNPDDDLDQVRIFSACLIDNLRKSKSLVEESLLHARTSRSDRSKAMKSLFSFLEGRGF